MNKFRLSSIAATAIVVAGIASFGTVARRAYSTQYQPIFIDSANSVVAGSALSVGVGVQGPTSITIYSDPVGAVSYSGTVDSTTATVSAATDPNASGPVTVYLATDGESTVSESIYLQDGAEN